MKRALNVYEAAVTRKVAERLPGHDGAQLLNDLVHACVEEESSDGSRVIFGIDGYVRPSYRGQHSFGVEGTLQDKDGASITVILYADENGRLFELELIRWGMATLSRLTGNS
jgi:hypothetical protein